MISWIYGHAIWTPADSYIAFVCVAFFLNGAMLLTRRKGLPYHLGLLFIAIDAIQLAVIRMFIPVCKLWWSAYLEQFKSTLPQAEQVGRKRTSEQ